MSRKERLDIEIWDIKMEILERDGWRCVYEDPETGERCPKQATQLAHMLPNDVLHLARYGPLVIHHRDNMRGTCPKHNASVQINYRAQPRKADAHAAKIRETIEEENHG